MTHDITHCEGVGCQIKDDCIRYKAHIEVEQGKYKSMRVSYFIDGYICERAKIGK